MKIESEIKISWKYLNEKWIWSERRKMGQQMGNKMNQDNKLYKDVDKST